MVEITETQNLKLSKIFKVVRVTEGKSESLASVRVFHSRIVDGSYGHAYEPITPYLTVEMGSDGGLDPVEALKLAEAIQLASKYTQTLEQDRLIALEQR